MLICLFICKEGILERNVVLKVKLNPLIFVNRVFYDEFENLDPKKRKYFQYLLNSIAFMVCRLTPSSLAN